MLCMAWRFQNGEDFPFIHRKMIVMVNDVYNSQDVKPIASRKSQPVCRDSKEMNCLISCSKNLFINNKYQILIFNKMVCYTHLYTFHSLYL